MPLLYQLCPILLSLSRYPPHPAIAPGLHSTMASPELPSPCPSCPLIHPISCSPPCPSPSSALPFPSPSPLLIHPLCAFFQPLTLCHVLHPALQLALFCPLPALVMPSDLISSYPSFHRALSPSPSPSIESPQYPIFHPSFSALSLP